MIKKLFFFIVVLFSLRGYSQCTWQPLGSNELNEPNVGEGYAPDMNCFARDNNGVSYYLFIDYGKLSLRKFNGRNWLPVGNRQFSTRISPLPPGVMALTLDKDNNPYVAYIDSATYRIKVMSYIGGNWTLLDSSISILNKTYNCFWLDIKTDTNGLPVVAWSEGQSYNIPNALPFIKAAAYNGTGWDTLGKVGIPRGKFSLQISKTTNAKYLAYMDETMSYYTFSVGWFYGVMVKTYNGTNWIPFGTADFNYAPVDDISMAIDNNGVPYVGYYDVIQKYNGTSWVNVGSPLNTYAVNCVALDSLNNVYYSATRKANSDTVCVFKYNGSVWQLMGGNGYVPPTVNLTTAPTSLVVNGQGKPFVFTNFDQIYTLNGSAWQHAGDGGNWNIGDNAILSVDKNGKAYVQIHNPGFAPIVLYYNDTSWVPVGPYSSTFYNTGGLMIKFDSHKTPYFLIIDSAANTSLLKFNGTRWVSVGPYGFLPTGTYADFTIGKGDSLFITSINSSYEQATYMYNGTNWNIIGSGYSQFPTTGQHILNSQIITDTGGNPMVVLQYSNQLSIIIDTLGTNNWSLLGSCNIPATFNTFDMCTYKDNLYIVYNTSQTNYPITVLHWTPMHGWDTLGPAISGFCPATSIKVDSLGNVYIAGSRGDTCGVKKYNGTNWVDLYPDAFNGDQTYPLNIAIDGSGIPYLLYEDYYSNSPINHFAFHVRKMFGSSPSASISSLSPSPTCALSNIELSASTSCTYPSYTWQYYNGSTYTNLSNSLLYSGVNSPTLSLNNVPYTYNGFLYRCVVSSSCSYANSNDITLNLMAAPTVSVTPSNTQLCIGNSTTLTASGSAGTYTWSTGSNDTTIAVTPTLSTSYTVSGTGINNCINAVTVSVTVNKLPTITVPNGTVCPGNSFTISPSGAVTYTYSSGSTVVWPTMATSYTVTGTDANGCTNTGMDSVKISSTPMVTINSGTICAGNSFTLNPSGAVTYTLSGGNYLVSPMVTTNYTVTGANSSGCIDIAVDTVIVNPTPSATVYPTNATCAITCNGTAKAIVSGGSTPYIYAWSTSGLNTDSIGGICPNTSPQFLTVVGSNGCQQYLQFMVNSPPLIVVNIPTATHTVCPGSYATLTSSTSGGIMPYTYSWTPSASLNTYTLTTVVANPTVTTTYSLIVEDMNHCTMENTTTVIVANCTGIEEYNQNTSSILIYPNPSNSNITIKSGSELGTVFIYNSLGDIVLQTTSKNMQEQIDISKLSPSIYTIQAQNSFVKLIKE